MAMEISLFLISNPVLIQRFDADLYQRNLDPFRKSNTFSVTFFSSLALLVLAVFYYYHYT